MPETNHPTDGLLQNAIFSIQLGVEDYQSQDTRRPLSAARNFFAGVLLLAKYAIIKAAPNADPEILIGAKLKLVLDGDGSVKSVVQGKNTIEFSVLSSRLKDFEMEVDHVALEALNRIRNDIEHRYPNTNASDVREVIAKAFPVVASLCRHLGLAPAAILGDAWIAMLTAKDLFAKELAECQATFLGVKWRADCLKTAAMTCKMCYSPLVYQEEPVTDNPEDMEIVCRSCGAEAKGPEFVEHLVCDLFGADDHISARDGDGWQTVYTCTNCGKDTYLMYCDEPGCALCGHDMGKCDMCERQLGPDNVSSNEESYCCDCDYRYNKDD